MIERPMDDNLSEAYFAELVKFTHDLTGITILPNRKSMLVSRLRSRLRATNTTNFNDYLRLLKSDSGETEHYVNAVTTNKTLFYRTPRIWSYLKDEFVPAWIKAGHNRPMEVWSGASSTGEEIYTAGMVLEEFRKKHPGFDYRIVGTDISDRVVDIADKGIYSGRIVDMFKTSSPDLFAKYMVGNDADGYSVNSDIRSRIKFQRHNVFKPFQTRSKYDVSLLRNVLIYFTHEDQESAIANVERSLRPDGLLIIGESETLSPLQTNYVCVAPLIYRHRDYKVEQAA
ncbi:MAG: protein-glutamate O-methyltransferase CheR [Henriciella sp.]|nr:protein-glutamate O-methyltransferase CheR [Henriciella sp.]